VVKCHGGTFKVLVPHCLLPIEVVLRRHLAHPRSCSLHLVLHFIAAAPPGRSSVSDRSLRSSWCKDVEALHGRVGGS
jgi:hypothetical protein